MVPKHKDLPPLVLLNMVLSVITLILKVLRVTVLTGWAGLGGVKDIDGDTEITAQQNNTDTDVLAFITDGTQRMSLSATDLSINTHVVLEEMLP